MQRRQQARSAGKGQHLDMMVNAWRLVCKQGSSGRLPGGGLVGRGCLRGDERTGGDATLETGCSLFSSRSSLQLARSFQLVDAQYRAGSASSE